MNYYVYSTPGNELLGMYLSEAEAQREATKYNSEVTATKAFVSKVWIMKETRSANHG